MIFQIWLVFQLVIVAVFVIWVVSLWRAIGTLSVLSTFVMAASVTVYLLHVGVGKR